MLSQVLTNSRADDGRHFHRVPSRLAKGIFDRIDPNRKGIVAWDLHTRASTIQHEEVIDRSLPRLVVPYNSIKKGSKSGGIYKIHVTFRIPGTDETHNKWGTAFVINKFHVLTSAHLMWSPEYGFATMATLHPDIREDPNGNQRMACVTAAFSVKYIDEPWAVNNLCVIAVAKHFDVGMPILQYHRKPKSLDTAIGKIIGYPSDMPLLHEGQKAVSSEGRLKYRKRYGANIVEHKINTRKGSSGSPVMVDGRVIAVHSGFDRGRKVNLATPIEHSRPISKVVFYMRNQRLLPKGVKDKGEVKGLTYPGQEMRLFV